MPPSDTDIYLAGPLFSEAERAWNVRLCAELEARGWRVYLPQRDSEEPAEGDRAEALFQANVAGLRGSRVVVAVLEGVQADDGTAWEVGYACALGKPVFALRTDFRAGGDDGALNLMLTRSVSLSRGTAELLAALQRFFGAAAR